MDIGDDAPEFSLPGTDDKTYSINDFSDAKALVVIFSCNHCPYAVANEDRIMRYQADFKDKGVSFVVINSNSEISHPQDNFERMKERSAKKGFNFPYLRDESQDVAHAYDALVTPHAFIFNADSKLVYKGAIDDNWEDGASATEFYLKDAIDATLGGNRPEVTETDPVGCSVKWR